jgi:hypothetical protein
MVNKHVELPTGVTLQHSSLGGLAVYMGGKPVGWMHESGEMWNAYIRQPNGEPGKPLGRFAHYEAVLRIAREAGWPGSAG